MTTSVVPPFIDSSPSARYKPEAKVTPVLHARAMRELYDAGGRTDAEPIVVRVDAAYFPNGDPRDVAHVYH